MVSLRMFSKVLFLGCSHREMAVESIGLERLCIEAPLITPPAPTSFSAITVAELGSVAPPISDTF